MSEEAKKTIIREHVENTINNAVKAMKENLERVLKSGCIDIEGYDENINPMVLPKAIVTALLEEEASQLTPFSKNKEFEENRKNIKHFI